MATYIDKYMIEVPYEEVLPAVQNVYDIVDAYCIAKTLSGEDGNKIKRNLVNQPVSDNVIAISGNNYKFNCFADRIDLLLMVKINGYDNIDVYKKQLEETGANFECRHKPIGFGGFEVRFTVKFDIKINQEQAMKIFHIFDIN